MQTKHLIIDGKADPGQLGNVDTLARMLSDMVRAAGMQIIDGPHICRVPFTHECPTGGFKDTGGVTVTAVLSTSHVSIHTWPAHGYFSFDLFSCKPYNPDAILEHLGQRLQATEMVVTTLNRPDYREYNHVKQHLVQSSIHHQKPARPRYAAQSSTGRLDSQVGGALGSDHRPNGRRAHTP